MFTAEVEVDACASCGEAQVPAALVIAFERAIAAELARRGPISGETFRWIRRAASLERGELAQLVGASVETIAAWEEERRATDVAAWTLVATIALDAIEGPRPLRARVKARGRGTRASGVARLAIDPTSSGSLAQVLDLLAASVALTETEIADALDLDCGALQVRLRHLAALGLIRHVNSCRGEVLGWEPVSRDRAALRKAAAVADVDLDRPLPRAKRASEARPATTRARAAPATWRASS